MSLSNVLPVVGFDCPRTCPMFERIDVCRFNALVGRLGVRSTVNSHTVRVDVRFTDPGALGAAAEELGGRVVGLGSHKLFAETVDGFAVHLDGWRYPIVATSTGSIAFDNYNGQWGAQSDVDALRAAYSMNAAEQAAAALGWMTERTGAGLVVFHPDGGTLTVDAAGGVDANGFNGRGCHEAAAVIGSAIGKPAEFIAKPEFYNAEQRLNAAE